MREHQSKSKRTVDGDISEGTRLMVVPASQNSLILHFQFACRHAETQRNVLLFKKCKKKIAGGSLVWVPSKKILTTQTLFTKNTGALAFDSGNKYRSNQKRYVPPMKSNTMEKIY